MIVRPSMQLTTMYINIDFLDVGFCNCEKQNTASISGVKPMLEKLIDKHVYLGLKVQMPPDSAWLLNNGWNMTAQPAYLN